jgi:TolB-like protein
MYIKILFLIIFLVSSINASEKISMAIYDFEASEISQALADSVADFIQSGLYDTGRFNIIERKNVQKILKEQQFQKTGCTTTECAVEVGRLLNVSNIITGRVSKIGKTIVISMQLIDVEAGKVILTDKVETDSEDLLNTASTELAKHFSKGVSIKGKVLKVLNENEIIINLGIADNLEKNQRLTIERISEAVKDDTGKVVYQIKKKIATVIPEEIMEEASKAKVLSKEDIIKEGDLIEIKREKLKPLAPIRAGYAEYTTPETGTDISQKRQEGVDMGSLGFGIVFGGKSDASYVTLKDTLTNNTLTPKGAFATLEPITSYIFEGGGSILTGDMQWLFDLIMKDTLTFAGLKDLSGQRRENVFFGLLSLTVGTNFFPFTPLINPEYQTFKTVDEQRGWFAPYIGISITGSIGMYDPDTSDTINHHIGFIYGYSAEGRVGIEFFNVLYAEFIYTFASSIVGRVDWYDSNWNEISYSDYDFKLPTTSFAFGVKIPL